MSQQALTIAVSSTGLPKLFNALIVSGNAFASALDGQTASDQNLNIGQVPDTNIDEYVVQLNTGSFANASATMNSVTQVSPGSNQFVLQFTVAVSVNFATWIESGRFTRSSNHGTYHIPFNNVNCGSFGFYATNISLDATVQISQNDQDQWEFIYVTSSSNSSNANFIFGYPEQSVLYQYNNSCGASTISNSLEDALEEIDYSSAIQAAITPILNSISESGQLTSAIVFDWTPNTFVFPPSSNSLQSGVTGAVTYSGTPFPSGGLNPPNLALPPVVSSSDVQIYAADYLFSSLYWAYYSAGQLSQTITPSMLAEPALLNTSSYKSSIPDLFTQYPNDNMQVVVAQSTAPVITFVSAYQLQPPYILTPQDMFQLQSTLPASDYSAVKNGVEGNPYNTLSALQTALQSALGSDYNTYQAAIVALATTPTVNLATQLPASVYADLLNLAGLTFLTQDAYVSALESALGPGPAGQYQQIILNASNAVIASLAHSPTLTFSVLDQGSYVQVFVIQIQETDVLINFQLGTSGTAQTIQSLYQVQGIPTATLVSSIIPDVNTQTLGYLWQFSLSAVYATIMQSVASTGVPLPFIEGYTFQSSSITLQPGYADLVANIQFNS
ncbi:MAG TPA: hypothetical protein VN776_02865 [Terracidiphilus sp.]|nr:hypothetical protein [Terracidiphilus sp.]